MPRLVVFNSVSLDGYFTDRNGDVSWAHKTDNDREWHGFVEDNASHGGVLLFGRVTYELMVSHWPTPEAMKQDPVVARQMNNLPKVVFSKTLEKVTWNNTRLVKGHLVEEVQRMKKEPGQDIVIFGSGSIISQLASENLIDEYQMVVIPIVLGDGRTMFEGVEKRLALKLTRTRIFGNGNAFLCYQPAE